MARKLFSCTGCIAVRGFLLHACRCGRSRLEKISLFSLNAHNRHGQAGNARQVRIPEICVGCHPEIHAQWKGSMHSNAFVDPVFQALWKMGEKDTKGFTKNLCGGCHTAIGVVSGDLTFKDNQFVTSEIARKGVQCDVCHTIKDSSFLETPTYEPNNASLIVAPGDVKRGPYKDSVSPYHKSEYSELHTKSKFCANCHQVFHPVSNFHIERTYDEWKYSVYAQNDIQCQDCHMMPVEKSIEAARTMKKPVRTRASPAPWAPSATTCSPMNSWAPISRCLRCLAQRGMPTWLKSGSRARPSWISCPESRKARQHGNHGRKSDQCRRRPQPAHQPHRGAADVARREGDRCRRESRFSAAARLMKKEILAKRRAFSAPMPLTKTASTRSSPGRSCALNM